ncbi:MAG: hypothetical protein LBL83_06265 [Clostridiales bacterium]|jgi:hypothetical protein|nr:hypothetical protein [Clostridiales bacterium]
MGLIRNARFMRVAAAAVLALSLFVGTTRSLGELSRKAEATFYSGVRDEAEGYARPSANSQLEARADAALGLVAVAANYGAQPETDNLRRAREAVLAADSIAGKGAANGELGLRFDELCAKLAESGADGPFSLSERDAGLVSAYANDFRGAQRVIDSSGYNDEARKVLDAASQFPASLFAVGAFVDYPDAF